MANEHIASPGPRVKNLVGLKFGRLTVESFAGPDKWGQATWKCHCECGNFTTVVASAIKKGFTKSCGCYNRDVATKHGLSTSSEYWCWCAMKQRTCVPSHQSFPDYGGRGIFMCDEWKESFKRFYSDMGKKPSPYHSLDRIDNEKGYSKDNCRWATRTVQQRNLRSTRFIVHGGVRRSLSEWSEIKGIPIDLLRRRVRDGWDSQKTLETPSGAVHKVIIENEDDFEELLP